MGLLNRDFEAYYTALYDKRWIRLRESFLADSAALPYSPGLIRPYMMDRASILEAQSLRLPGEGTVLDACAAPGGKKSEHGRFATLLLDAPCSSERMR
jgi:16S rRNA (cytosine1407-C5)-methyltransferase